MSKTIEKLITVFTQPEPEVKEDERIQVNYVISKAAKAYEKIRNLVDYVDEHLFRKNAIYRILKRKLLLERVILENYLLEKYHHENIAEQLLQELIRGGYLEHKVPEKMIGVVDDIIKKYNLLIAEIKQTEGKVNKKLFFYLLEMCAVEIEGALIPADKEKSLARAMFSTVNPRLKLNTSALDEKEKEMQLYLACHRVLFKWDNGMLRYLLLTLYYPTWKNADKDLISKIANNIVKLQTEFEKQIKHPWRHQIMKILKRKAVVFWIIQDLIDEYGEKAADIFADPEKLEAETKKACQKRYKGVRAKLRRAVVRSIIYVFFTKMILALAIEFPVDYYLAGGVNYLTAAVNIIFPPLLMLLVAVTIRMPKKKNTEEIIDQVKQISLGAKTDEKFVLKRPRTRGRVMKFIFNLVYFLTFIFSIIVICWILNKFDFNVASAFIFILFLTLVSFFGIRIRRPVKDIMAVEKRDSALGSVIEFFALPFVSLGRWLSTKFSKINFFVFFLDFIIEAPFKLLIVVFEDLFGFIREKKEEAMNE